MRSKLSLKPLKAVFVHLEAADCVFATNVRLQQARTGRNMCIHI